MKKIVIAFVLSLTLINQSVAEEDVVIKPVAVGDTFKPYTLEDPHGTLHTMRADTKLVIMSFEMELSKGIHAWLETKDADFLEKNKAEYVADITEMPDIITFLFARPKMRKYPFQILLADDDNFAPQFPKEEGRFVAFELSPEKVVTNISYFATMDDLDKAYFSKDVSEFKSMDITPVDSSKVTSK